MSYIEGRKKTQVKPRALENVPATAETDVSSWTFFSNHAHVLFCLAAQPDMVLREVAARVGITERAVQRIIAELEEAGVLSREKEGRRNRYVINLDATLRHPIEAHCTVGTLINVIHG
jgi:DNA-binding MarR family transcriptional regulator